MQKQTFAILSGALFLLLAGVLVVPQLLSDEETPLVRWSAQDEVDVEDDPADAEGGDASAAEAGLERSAVQTAEPGQVLSDEPRVDVLLRGRVVDKFQGPVADAKVWLDFSRAGQRGGPGGGRQRRVPDPVQTDREGRFAFQGQTFRNLRVSLQVAHPAHAAGLFDKDLGEIKAEVDLGDLVLTNGGDIVGRVTDLEGNGVLAAELRLQPENGNRMRMARDRDNLIPGAKTDNNGFFRIPHAAVGDWSLSVTAKRHTEGRSPTFAVEEDQQVELEDIRLGPGFEATGYVRTSAGQPIAKAQVTLRSQNRGRPGRGGRGEENNGGFMGFGGRDHSTTTDEQGRFFLEHLPAGPMRLEARADGYLDFSLDGVDPTLGQPILVALQDGLRIAGRAVDSVEGTPVSLFAVRAVRLRGLPVPGQGNVNLNDLMTRMRDGNLDEATRQQIRTEMEGLRSVMGEQRRGGPGMQGRGNQDQGQAGPQRNGGPGRDLGKPERHADGAFVVTGLQEGVYEVHVQSPEHARFRSQEVELRLGVAPPSLTATLDRGVFVAGVVVSDKGQPVAGARVELRTATAGEGAGRRRGRQGPEAAAGAAAPDLEAMGREAMRQFSGAQVTLEATTDAEGVFVVKHAQRGTYRLQAQSRGFATATSEPFDLQADRSGFELLLGSLGSIAGRVRGLQQKELGEARVAAIQVGGTNGGPGGMGRGRGGNGGGGGGPWSNVSVQPDGTYRIDDLTPGDYVVRSWVGSPQELMRELGPQFFGGTMAADVKVRAGETTDFDVGVTRPQVGTVAGTVLHNGSPATGFQIELSRIEDAGATPERGPGRGGRMAGFGRSFQAAVTGSGRFTIASVPAGAYRLRVQAGRRGGMLHEEQVQVAADTTVECNLSVSTASLEGSVTRDDGGSAGELNGNVSLLPGLTEVPENFGAWRREPGNTTFDARLQAGKFRFETLKPGNYLVLLTVRGRERTSTPIFVSPGSGQSIVLAAGKATAPAATPGTPNPAANRPAGSVPR